MRIAFSKAILLLLILCTSARAFSQEHSDTIGIGEVVLPSALIASGVLIHSNNWLKQQQINLRDYIVEHRANTPQFENITQYIPTISVIGLKALGVESKHSYKELATLLIESHISGFIIVESTKRISKIERPNYDAFNSFVSGHTATAFIGAEILRREYGQKYPLIAITGYLLATTTGVMRVYNNWHWAADVVAGAGIGILTTSAVYWLNNKTNNNRFQATAGGLCYNF